MLDIQIAPVYGRSMDEEQQKVEELKKERIALMMLGRSNSDKRPSRAYQRTFSVPKIEVFHFLNCDHPSLAKSTFIQDLYDFLVGELRFPYFTNCLGTFFNHSNAFVGVRISENHFASTAEH